MAADDPLFWFETRHKKRIVRVYLATCEGHPELKGLAGLCYPKDGLIFVNVLEDKRSQDATLIHELGHFAAHGVRFVSHGAEERLLNHSDHAMYSLLRGAGLVWPERPEGYHALKRKAQRMYESEFLKKAC